MAVRRPAGVSLRVAPAPAASGDPAQAATTAPAGTGATATGMPLSTALPDTASTTCSSASTLLFVAGVLRRDALGGPGHVVAPAVREAARRPGITVSVTSTRADRAPGARAQLGRLAVGQSEAVGVVGVDLERAALRALDEHRQVVHPRVVGAQLAAADEHDARRSGASERRRASRGTSVTSGSGASSILPLAVRSASGRRGFSGAEVDPVRRGLERRERQLGTGRRGASGRAAARGRRRGSSSASTSSMVRPWSGEPSVLDLALDHRAGDEFVERGDVRVRAETGRDARQPQERHPLVGERPGRAPAPAASSWRRCGAANRYSARS